MSLPTIPLLYLGKKDFDRELMEAANIPPEWLDWVKHHATVTLDTLRDNANPDGIPPGVVAMTLLLALFLVGRVSNFDRPYIWSMIEDLWPKLDNIAGRMADAIIREDQASRDAPLIQVHEAN